MLEKQRDEAERARASATLQLRQRVVREAASIAAIKAGFADAATQLRLLISGVQGGDEVLVDELAERDAIKRRLDGYRARMAAKVIEGWRNSIIRRAWDAWHGEWAKMRQAERVERLAANATERLYALEEEKEQLEAEAEDEIDALRRRVKDLQRVNHAAELRAGEQRRAAERQGKEVERLRRAHDSVTLRLARLEIGEDQGEEARQAEALWFEERELLLQEMEALRRERGAACGSSGPSLTSSTSSAEQQRQLETAQRQVRELTKALSEAERRLAQAAGQGSGRRQGGQEGGGRQGRASKPPRNARTPPKTPPRTPGGGQDHGGQDEATGEPRRRRGGGAARAPAAATQPE